MLVVAAQQYLSGQRLWQDRHPVLQSTSQQNHRVERMWPEVNQRINYPVKRILVEMESRDEIDMTNDMVKFCVSWTVINVIEKAVHSFVLAWNAHRIPGRRGGVPNILASRSPQTASLPTSDIPSTYDIVRIYKERGGTRTPEHSFGRDPLERYEWLQDIRKHDFCQRFPSTETVFQETLHGNGSLLRDAIQYFIRLTISLSQLF